METVVTIILLLVGFSFILKLTFHRMAGVAATAVVAALFVGASWETAILQSRSQIEDWLSQPDLMLDTSVLLTVDVAMQLAFCILTAKKESGGKLSRVECWLRTALLWFPGVLVFPALFVMLVALIFSMPGSDFVTVAWTTAAGVGVLCPLAAWGLRSVMDETETRLELMFLLNALIAILGVVATVNGRTAVAGVNAVDWSALAGVFAILAVGIVAGMYLYHRKKSSLS